MISSHSTTSHRPYAAAGLLMILAGCAAVEANRRVPGVIADGIFTPARGPSLRFGVDGTRGCPVAGAYTATYDQVAKGIADRGATPAQADGQLCAVAEAFLGWSGDSAPREAVRAFVAHHFGLVSSSPQVIVTTLESEDSRQVGESIANTVLRYANQVATPRYGLATDRLSKGKTRAVIVLDNPRVAVDPLPRRLELREKATLSGTLVGDLENPKVSISDAQGVVSEPAQVPGKVFKAEVACGEAPGRILVEIRGEEMGNENIMASFTVACGGPALPVSVAVALPTWPATVGEQEALLRKVIDAERASGGIPALTWSEPVANIARAVSESNRDAAKKGGMPSPVNVVQRLGDADLQATVVLQNPAAGPTAEAASERLLASPSHRATVMSREVSTGGIGVALGIDQAGKPVAYLTQLFIKVQAPPDVAAARQTIRQAIDRKRAAEKLAALTSDPVLEKLAGDYAAAVAAAGGPPPKSRTEEFERALKKAYRDVVLLRDSRIDLADFAEDPNALAKGRLVGLGAAVGRHPRLGKNTLFVVLIIANKLPGK